MMKGLLRSACAATLLLAMPAATLSQPRGGGTAGGPAAPVSRAAPVARPAPQTRPAPPSAGGFNFNRDINAHPAPVRQSPITPQHPITPQRPTAPQLPIAPQQPVTPQRPVAAQQPTMPQRPPARRPNPPTVNYPHAPSANTSGGPYHGRFHGPVVRNSHAPVGAWEWNHGVVWQPAPVYWGGGFWGPFAISALMSSLLFGSIIDYQNQLIYPSYQVEPDSPGAQLLQDYGLQQTQCGSPNLVVIWGPNNSVICAYPNASVAAGNYEIDPSTFALVPASP